MMTTDDNEPKPSRWIHSANGRIYFSREAERRFFFILTIGMAVFGLLVRLDWI